jgi:hypothetical protein
MAEVQKITTQAKGDAPTSSLDPSLLINARIGDQLDHRGGGGLLAGIGLDLQFAESVKLRSVLGLDYAFV